MTGGENIDSIPIDLVMEILSRLPAKTIVRCRCVSKRLNSMILCPDFTDLFKTKTLAQPPRLLFAVKRSDNWCFLTSPQPQNPDEKSLSLATDFHMKFPGFWPSFGGHASGFIHLRRTGNYRDSIGSAICNPSTGQYLRLPLLSGEDSRRRREFLGFDPINKQFKVLSITVSFFNEKRKPNQILTLGQSWRKIHCPLNHDPVPGDNKGICINGVLYYLAKEDKTNYTMIVCFDVRYEKFKFIYRDFDKYDTKLVDYKGRLGMIVVDYGIISDYPGIHYSSITVCIWVIKDAENPESEWLEDFSIFWEEFAINCNISIVGVTTRGDIVLSKSSYFTSDPPHFFYIYPERNTIQMIEIQGLGENYLTNIIEVFADYVENLNNVNTALKQDRSTFENINKFEYLRLLDDA